MSLKLRLFGSFMALCVLFTLGHNLAVAQAKPTGPTATDCSLSPAGAYDPTCDVDHDGDIDIFDIQLVAGRWNQTGSYVDRVLEPVPATPAPIPPRTTSAPPTASR